MRNYHASPFLGYVTNFNYFPLSWIFFFPQWVWFIIIIIILFFLIMDPK